MSLPISRFISRTYNIKDRDVVPKTFIQILDVVENEEGFLISATVQSVSNKNKIYNCLILTDELKINLNTQIKVFCTCESFQYQFETILDKNKALLGTARSTRLPKRQDVHVCKHLEALIKFLLPFKNIQNLQIKRKK